MRVALYHNPTAGTQAFTGDDIARSLRARDYQVDVYASSDDGAAAEALESRPDVVVAAGGDGTVAKLARKLWQRRSSTPVFILPAGTSNNIARSLGVGIRETVPELVDALAHTRDAALDVGIAVSGDGRDEKLFVESAGVGFFGIAMHAERSFIQRARGALAHLIQGGTQGEAQVRAHARGVAQRLRSASARPYSIVADGVDLSGEYVAVEAMNIRAIGPRVTLAPEANVNDGMLELVFVRREDCNHLAQLIDSQRPVWDALPGTRRVREVEVSWPRGVGHIDDEAWAPSSRGRDSGRDAPTVRLIAGGAVRLLLPS